MAQSEQKKIYSGIWHAYNSIHRHEGFLVLYRGLWPTLLQIAPHAGVQFMCYKLFDRLYKLCFHQEHATITGSLFSGSLAGLVSKTAIYPFDLAKKRMQVQGFEAGRVHFGGHVFKCRGLNDCLVQIYAIEGIGGLFKGLSPSLLKAVFATALHFSSYEMICRGLEKRKGA